MSSFELNYLRRGTGEPLVLLHGSGAHWQVWEPVLDLVSRERDVIAVDLPGFGDSPPVPSGVAPSAAGLAQLLAAFLDSLGLDRAHVGGNSIGGWTALELAKLGRARSVTAIGPAGLWPKRLPRYCAASFAVGRAGHRLAPVLPRLAASRVGRTAMLGQMCGRPWKIPPDAAQATVRCFVESTGFPAHLAAITNERFSGGQEIDVPVTIAWGTRDLMLLPWQARQRHELPPHTVWRSLRGCGHVPMWDDPPLVAQVLLDGSKAAPPTAQPAVG